MSRMKMFSEAYQDTNRGFDAGLRAYMLKVYSLMGMALALSGITAYAVMTMQPIAELLFNFTPNGYLMGRTGLGYIVMFAPLGIGLYFFWGIGRMNLQTAQTLFWAYAGLTGASLASIGYIYTATSIAKTFFISSTAFGSMSIYGQTTQRDLTSIGSFLTMGAMGLFIALVVNAYYASPAIDYALSFLGVFIFMGITAYDAQRLKSIYYTAGSGEMGQRAALLGAFTLYLDFINLFLYLIRFFGVRREE